MSGVNHAGGSGYRLLYWSLVAASVAAGVWLLTGHSPSFEHLRRLWPNATHKQLALAGVAILLWWLLPPRRSPQESEVSDDGFEDASEKHLEGETEVPKHPHLQGCFIPSTGLLYSNPREPFEFENEFCTGQFLPLHRPTYDKAVDKSGAYPYAAHFHGRKRLWEMRLQLKFKVPIERRIWFGIEHEEYVPVSRATHRMQDLLVGMMTSVVGKGLYYSAGEDPKKVTASGKSLERPVFVMPMWAVDQFAETPPGEEPPSLREVTDDTGMRRTRDRRKFTQMLEGLRLRPGPTYTFCFWGVSQFLDNIMWKVRKIPFKWDGVDFNSFCGKPPVHMVIYTLRPTFGDDADAGKHLESRKDYVFRLAFWSSRYPPRRARLEQLMGASEEREGVSPSRRKRSRLEALLACCVERRA